MADRLSAIKAPTPAPRPSLTKKAAARVSRSGRATAYCRPSAARQTTCRAGSGQRQTNVTFCASKRLHRGLPRDRFFKTPRNDSLIDQAGDNLWRDPVFGPDKPNQNGRCAPASRPAARLLSACRRGAEFKQANLSLMIAPFSSQARRGSVSRHKMFRKKSAGTRSPIHRPAHVRLCRRSRHSAEGGRLTADRYEPQPAEDASTTRFCSRPTRSISTSTRSPGRK